MPLYPLVHRSLFCALLGLTALPALAQTITLRSLRSDTEFTGKLLNFTDGTYVIETGFGVMRASVDTVTCISGPCPGGQSPATTGQIRIAGSDSLGFGLIPKLLSAYASQQGGETVFQIGPEHITAKVTGASGTTPTHFEIRPTIASDAFRGLLDGSAEIGASTRPISQAETRALAAIGGGDMGTPAQEHVVGISGLVMIVNPNNNIGVMGALSVGKIYSGEVRNWAELGGPDVPITTFARQGDSGPGGIFNNLVFEGLGFPRSPDIEVVNSNTAMLDAVNADLGAIGFVEHYYTKDANPLRIRSQCGIIFQTNAFAIKTEEYPFINRLFLYNRADTASAATRGFLEYAGSPEADAVVTDAGFIGLGILRTAQNQLDGRLGPLLEAQSVPNNERRLHDRIIADLLQYDRLSTTVRFDSGSSQLDNKVLVDLDRLADYLSNIRQNVEVSLVGFADSDGGFAMNTNLSNARARRVASALTQLSGGRLGPNITLSTRGYSELSPAVCNLTPRAKGINRRVEVWIKPL